MGYVNESSVSEPRAYQAQCSQNGLVIKKPAVLVTPKLRQQYGFRTGPLSKSETDSIRQLDATGKRSDIVRQLDALDRLDRATSSTPWRDTDPFIVNDRDFRETHYTPALTAYKMRATMSGIDTRVSGVTLSDLQGINSPFSAIDVESFRAEASETMRRIVPTRPEWDLTRFVFELRDVNRIFATAASLPDTWRTLSGYRANVTQLRNGVGAAEKISTGGRTAGASYLAYQFGVAPTISDVEKGAAAILTADQKFGQFVRDSAKLVKRSSSKMVDQSHDLHRFTELIPAFGVDGYRMVLGDSTGQGRYLTRSWLRPDTVPLNAASDTVLSYSATRQLRVFATFEYFVGDPDGFVSRMDEYVAKAKKIVGGGLTTSVMYELMPWSWMIDWHLDIGGLLNYQQSVADYGTVARRAGFVIEDDLKATLERRPAPLYIGSQNEITGTSIASVRERIQHRRAGSPYSMDFGWNYGSFQWSILGALGLTKAPRTANRR